MTHQAIAMHDRAEMYPFGGDGRRVMEARGDAPNGTWPIPVTRSNAHRLVRKLIEDGKTYHSPLGSTIWVLFVWARIHNRKIVMRAQEHQGEMVGWEAELIKEPS